MKWKSKIVELLVVVGILALIVSIILPDGLWPQRVGDDYRGGVEPATRPTGAPHLRSQRWTLATYPRVDGSTSTYPLQVLIAGKALDQTDALWEVELDRHSEPVRFVPRKEYGQTRPAMPLLERVQHTGTHPAYVNLIEGKASLILVARRPSADELALAAQRKVELRCEPVGYDALVFLLNAKNPVRGFTQQQARDIYAGKIDNWKVLGGPDQAIKAYRRNRNSGSQELMEQLVMKGQPMAELPEQSIYRVGAMGRLVDEISRQEAGIGFSLNYFVQWMWHSWGCKLAEVDGVAPNAANVRSGRYPLRTEVYCVTRADLSPGDNAAILRDWMLSDEGQLAVAESGLVPTRGQVPDWMLKGRPIFMRE